MFFKNKKKKEKAKIAVICVGTIMDGDVPVKITANDQFLEADIDTILDIVKATIFENTVKSKTQNSFSGMIPDEIIITTDRIKKTPADIEFEMLKRRLTGTASDYTNAILDDKGKIIGWKQ